MKSKLTQMETLKKYRHLSAALIAYSLGYFTPIAAVRAIDCYASETANGCEWYFDMAGLGRTKKLYEITDQELIDINTQVIRQAFLTRHFHRNSYKDALMVVDRNLAGHESIGASWF